MIVFLFNILLLYHFVNVLFAYILQIKYTYMYIYKRAYQFMYFLPTYIHMSNINQQMFWRHGWYRNNRHNTIFLEYLSIEMWLGIINITRTRKDVKCMDSCVFCMVAVPSQC